VIPPDGSRCVAEVISSSRISGQDKYDRFLLGVRRECKDYDGYLGFLLEIVVKIIEDNQIRNCNQE